MTRRLALVLALLGASSELRAQPRSPAPRAPARPALMDYRVLPGDTCVAIAQRLYRDVRRTNLIHENNPSLGRPPHRLRPGQVLRLPRAAPTRTEPDAILTQTLNTVEIGAPTGRRARGLDPLFRGTTVSTGSASTAEVTFADETQLRMSEQTTVVILGESNTRVRRLAGAGDTTLVRGSLRAFLGNLSAPAAAPVPGRPPAAARPVARPPARPLAIRTARGRVVLGSGEAGLSAAENGAVTLSVYRGQSRIQSGARSVVVREGFAVRAEEGRALTQHRLPVAPVWTVAPPVLVFAVDDRGRFEASWRVGDAPAGAAPPPAHEWHVQVARDPSFLNIPVDTHLAPGDARMAIPALEIGDYFVRVSAVDADHFEGPFAPVSRVRVVNPRPVPTATPYRSQLILGQGLRCGLDGAAMDPVTAPISLERRASHTLRCALEGRDDSPAEVVIPALSRSPLSLVTRLVVPEARAREGHVRVRVIDHEGEDLRREELRVRVSSGVTAGDLAAPSSPDPGVFLLPVRWTEAVREFSVTVEVSGADPLRSEALVPPDVPRPLPPPDPFARRLFARGDLLVGYMLSEYQRNNAAAAFGGNALGLAAGFGASARVGVDMLRPRPGNRGVSFGANVMASTWIYPSSLDAVAVATMYGGGLHLSFAEGRLVPWVEGNAGVVLTGPVVRFGVDLGVGLDIRLTRALLIGPTVRYVHVVQPDSDPFPEDARTLGGGLSLTLRAE